MNIIINFFRKKSNFWIKNIFWILIIALFANHLTDQRNFPLHDSYRFPWLSILISILIGSIIIIICYFNFRYFKNKHFIHKINNQILLRFIFSTLGYISIAYIALYFILTGLFGGGNYNFYGFFTGFSITILLSSIGIIVSFAKDIYELHKMTSIHGKLKVQQNGKITLIEYTDISFIYSENKIVFVVKTDGTTIITDFTLNDVESKISEHSFFRANRQTILHSRSIEQVRSIENGKLSVLLKPIVSNKKTFQINISRYKKQAFNHWLEKKL